MSDLHSIDKRLERIENKLDNHLERVSRAEEAIVSIKGTVKLVISTILAITSAAIAALLGVK